MIWLASLQGSFPCKIQTKAVTRFLSFPFIRGHSFLFAHSQETHSLSLLSIAISQILGGSPRGQESSGVERLPEDKTLALVFLGWVASKSWIGPMQPHYVQHETNPIHTLKKKKSNKSKR